MTNYLSVSNGNVVNQTNAGNAASWDKETVANGYMLKTVINGTPYYLKADSGYNVVVTDNSAEATVWDEIAANGNAKPKIYTVTGNTTEKALYYDGSIWKLVDYTIGGSGNDWGGSMDFKALNQTVYDNTPSAKNTTGTQEWYANDMHINMSKSAITDPKLLASNSNMVYRYRDGTYIPVNMDSSGNAMDTNTGYIVGRSGSTSAAAGVRSAAYPLKFIYRSLGGTSNSAVYDDSKVEILSKSGNNWVRIGDSHNEANTYVNSEISSLQRKSVDELGFVKYDAARNALQDLLTDVNHIHGIHFDTAAIVQGENTIISNAKILGQTITNYYVPKAGINFRLKETGKINFFAGTYYNSVGDSTETTSDSFFSLYYVNRTSNSSFTLKKISAIYENTGSDSNEMPYVYLFDDGSYSGNTHSSNAIFTMDVLESQPYKNQVLYYFEIPVNAGEYAMGAVKNGNTVKARGAYLIYLDISANATVEGDSQFNVGETAEPVYKTDAGIVEKTVSSTESASIMTPPTYFPLAWDNGAVSSSNTGYIISGAYTNSNPPGDIRVSKYEKSYSSNWRGIGNSLTNGILTDSKIYTYKFGNNGGWQTISLYGTDNLYKYLNSKAQLQETIGSAATGDVYGLHFMNASIGTSNLITVPNATINGHNYTDYEMPRDSIDFNLKIPGYINVFAGTYFSGPSVNCFFSLHKIERDANQRITSIREIKAIYKDNGSYNYQYAGGAAPSGTKVFDTDCLTQPNGLISDTVYYFEIPAGAGEFAIGSVDGKFGGYLLYLDISTHQGDSIVKREKMVINTVEYELPKGVIFDGADKTVFEVPITMTGDIEFTVNNGTVNATSPLTASSSSSSKTIEKVTVSDQAGEFSIKRTTENGNVTYEYSERALTENDTIEELAAYFNSSVNNIIFTYNYLLEENNSVNNVLEEIEYSTDVGFAITKYQITARAIVEAVTAMVKAIGSDASYIEFNEVANIQTSQTIIIPTQNNN